MWWCPTKEKKIGSIFSSEKKKKVSIVYCISMNHCRIVDSFVACIIVDCFVDVLSDILFEHQFKSCCHHVETPPYHLKYHESF